MQGLLIRIAFAGHRSAHAYYSPTQDWSVSWAVCQACPRAAKGQTSLPAGCKDCQCAWSGASCRCQAPLLDLHMAPSPS